MSLSCLTCGQILQRVDSRRDDYLPENNAASFRKSSRQVERTWSGNIAPPQKLGGAIAKIKAEHHRSNSAGDVGPRLVRSSGVRRDWNFEDLNDQQQEKRPRIY
ncbi:hypothetical protein PIB30_024384 [Stylosanthes scabra]|uniref:Uncharacterized protein n=1 Tax=Stylosanthes scabra TaxID=79078 RepID=A0ABU6SAG8_9FABA|nr:hypothetical protein [Stylosanthes scabra]